MLKGTQWTEEDRHNFLHPDETQIAWKINAPAGSSVLSFEKIKPDERLLDDESKLKIINVVKTNNVIHVEAELVNKKTSEEQKNRRTLDDLKNGRVLEDGSKAAIEMVNPDKGYFRTVKELETILGEPIVPKEWTLKDFYEDSEAMVPKYSPEERKAIYDYSNPEIASAINNMLRRRIAKTDELLQQVNILQEAMKKYELPEDTIVFRGVADYRWLFPDGLPTVGFQTTWEGFTSTSVLFPKASDYSKYTKDSVVFEIVAPKGTHGIPLGSTKLSQHLDTDREFLLNDKTKVEVTGVEKKGHGYYIKVRIVQ
ncbi:hypothetical protein FACS1894189_7490 [Planctomycetales bacterium]|nr:hypothetical protein FACS1894189_7490 [Planctomycetales bacterium]